MDEELAAIVGRRVRQLRLKAGHSLRRQAQLVGVAPSALSALENRRGGMSLAALQRVGNHFGVSITELLATPPPTGNGSTASAPDQLVEIFLASAAKTPNVHRGEGTIYQLLGSGPGHTLEPYMVSFLPGGGYDLDAIGHPGEEFTYVLAGEVDLHHGDTVHRLRQGDAVRFRTEAPHAFRNASSSGIAVIVGAATPPW